jgi:hypothetical protein
MKEKHSGSAITCQHCGIDCKTFAGLKMHINSKHTEVPIEYPCDICSMGGFLTAVEKNSHKRSAHGYKGVDTERRFISNICEKQFNTLNERKCRKQNEHDIIYANEKFKCDICQRNFPTDIRLSIHKNQCSKKDLTCLVCNKNFALPVYLKRHKLTHIKLK